VPKPVLDTSMAAFVTVFPPVALLLPITLSRMCRPFAALAPRFPTSKENGGSLPAGDPSGARPT
jgi:hypothetical protein